MAGEIVGNQSVYWRMRHHDNAGNPKPQTVDRGGAGLPGPNAVKVGVETSGHDDIAFSDIGKSYDPPRPGYFRVILRFRSEIEAISEMQNALGSIVGNVATVYVPAINRTNNNVSPANPPAEIEFDW
jgi:hypothetical protein